MTEELFLRAVGLFLMALVRFSAFFLNIPVFSESIVPMQSKAGISAFCALISLPYLIQTQVLPELTIMEYGLAITREFVLGYSLGYMVLVVMSVLRLGGQIMGQQMGFGFVQVADPTSNQSLGILSEFFQMSGTLLFLAIGGHLLVLQAFYESFRLVPINGLQLTSGVIEETILYTRTIFVCGLRIAMPIIGVILVGNVGLGIIARTVPKLNVFQIGFALKILIGLVIIIVLFPLLGDFIRQLLDESIGMINTILNLMSPNR